MLDSLGLLTFRKYSLSFLVGLVFISAVALTNSILAIENVGLKGNFNFDQNSFTGTISYHQIIPTESELYFHLPPNWYAKTDRRESYLLRNQSGETVRKPRQELTFLDLHYHSSVFKARAIEIRSVLVDGKQAKYEFLDNQYLTPRKSVRNALLKIRLQPETVGRHVDVKINFETRFETLPTGYRRVLWDFAPRPVWRSENGTDWRGDLCLTRSVQGAVDLIHSDPRHVSGEIKIDAIQSCPTVSVTKPVLEKPGYSITSDTFISDRMIVLSRMTDRVFSYLKKDGWLDGLNTNYRFIIWDTGLKTSGNTIFLPRRLFRYHSIYHKSFEAYLIRAVITCELRKRFVIDASLNYWILPAIYSEIIRAYFDSEYGGDTRQFPWIDWMNMDYPLENSVNEWVANSRKKIVVDANSPTDQAYSLQKYHPGYSKGFHLMWMTHGGVKRNKEVIFRQIRELLNLPVASNRRLTHDSFFKHFNDQTGLAERWLQADSRVDYELAEVNYGDGQVEIEITNNGSLSPPLELEITSVGEKRRVLLKNPVGKHVFPVSNAPEQVVLDPNRQLLEDDILNNSWALPVKIRPFGDFLSADKWVIGVYPLMQGNIFDQNLLGVSLSLDYMDRTNISANLWGGASTNRLLWEAFFYHNDYPFRGSRLVLEASQLGATESLLLGFEQEFFIGDNQMIVDAAGWTERLDDIDENQADNIPQRWAGSLIGAELEILRRAFFRWRVDISGQSAFATTDRSVSYQKTVANQYLNLEYEPLVFHLNTRFGSSRGVLPLQKKYPLGGTRGFAGYPRDTRLLFNEYRILEFGLDFGAALELFDPNLFRVVWLKYARPSIYTRRGIGLTGAYYDRRNFSDIEFRVTLVGEFFNRFVESFQLALAKPLNDDEYHETRFILESSWVF